MRSRLLHPATVIATGALVVVLSGSVFAATGGSGNLVGTADIQNGAVTLKKISTKAKAALRGAQGPAGAVGLRGATGATGPAGTAGAAGAAGAAGTAGTARAFGLVSSGGIVNAARSKNITVTKLAGSTINCPLDATLQKFNLLGRLRRE